MNPEIQPTICVDTREPVDGGWEPYFSLPTVRQKLDSGDYSLLGCQDWICCERKSLSDLISSLSHFRERFTEELRRGARIKDFIVIVEGRYSDILRGHYRSQMQPQAVWESIIALQQRFGIPFYMAETTEIAARVCQSILCRWHMEHMKALDTCRRAQKRLAQGG